MMPVFVIQKHDASHLHYDFRLEIGGVLKSWAVPKTPPRACGVKRLAVLTDDHDLSWGNFEGVIPEGQYGAGTVEIWDRGGYELKEGSFGEGKMAIELKGRKMKGVYALARMKDKNWLLFKVKKVS